VQGAAYGAALDPILCAHADRNGEVMHWLKADEACTAAFEREAGQ